jgi:hypothetical protein
MKPSLLLSSTVLLILQLVLNHHVPVNGFVLPANRAAIVKPAVPLRSITTTWAPLLYHRRDIDSSSTTALHAMPSAVTLMKTMQSMAHKDPSFVLSAVLLLSIFGVSLERRTTIGKALSAPLATMALALTVANLGVIPFASPVCEFKNVTFYVTIYNSVLQCCNNSNRTSYFVCCCCY